jgi:hypothetical protein
MSVGNQRFRFFLTYPTFGGTRSERVYIAFGITINYTFRQMGGAIGVAATVALLDIRETLHSSRLLDVANRLNPAVQNVVRHLEFWLHVSGLPSNIAHEGASRLFQVLVAKQTALLAFIDVFWGLAMLGVIGIALVLTFTRGRFRNQHRSLIFPSTIEMRGWA